MVPEWQLINVRMDGFLDLVTVSMETEKIFKNKISTPYLPCRRQITTVFIIITGNIKQKKKEKIMTEISTEKKAQSILAKYTLAAATTGAVPVPTASAAIIGENAIMIGHIANAMGQKVGIGEIAASIGAVGMVNQVGKAVFMEIGKLLSWGTGGWTMPLLMGAGAATAGLQTYFIGNLVIEICKNQGQVLDKESVDAVRQFSKNNYNDFIAVNK